MARDSLITAEIRALAGREVRFPNCEEIEKGMIRRFALAVGDLNPLYLDEEYARRSRYRGLIAPPTFIFEMYYSTVAELGEDGSPQWRFRLPPPLERMVRGGNEYTFARPVRPGDVLSSTWKVADIYERQGRTGRMVIVIVEASFTNQRGELGTNRETLIFLPPVSPAEDRPMAAVGRPAPELPASELPPLVKKITKVRMAMYAAATWDFNRGHYDREFAQGRGFPDVYIDGQVLGAYLAQLVTDWMGEGGSLKRLGLSYRGMVFPGDTVTCGGRVSRRIDVGDESRLDLELWIRNQHGQEVAPGRAAVMLPAGASPRSLSG